MNLELTNFERVKEKLQKVLSVEEQKIDQVNEWIKRLDIQELKNRNCTVIAPVATDGGDSKVSFEPINLDIIRIVDSNNDTHVWEFIPLSAEPKTFKDLFESIDVLKEMLDILSIDYDDVSYKLPTLNNMTKDEKDNTQFTAAMREIIEWAVLLKLAQKELPGGKLLLIKDGLLRTTVFKDHTFEKLKRAFETAYRKSGTLLVGVAKKSKVLNYISLSITMNSPFSREYACFCKVPAELERLSYKFAQGWMFQHSFGSLHLAKLTQDPYGLILPVDIPYYLEQEGRQKEILEYLVKSSASTFPTPGYPDALIKAHENAAIKEFEKEVIYTYLMKVLKDRYKNEQEKERFVRFVTLYKNYNINGGGYSGRILREENRNF